MLAAASICTTDAQNDSWRRQDSNAVNETFWDAQNLEIEACANSEDFSGSGKISRPGKIFVDSMLGGLSRPRPGGILKQLKSLCLLYLAENGMGWRQDR